MAVGPHVVRMNGPWLEILDQHERVVVALHVERACSMPEHLHLGGSRGLHPNGRRLRAHVPEERAEDETGLA